MVLRLLCALAAIAVCGALALFFAGYLVHQWMEHGGPGPVWHEPTDSWSL